MLCRAQQSGGIVLLLKARFKRGKAVLRNLQHLSVMNSIFCFRCGRDETSERLYRLAGSRMAYGIQQRTDERNKFSNRIDMQNGIEFREIHSKLFQLLDIGLLNGFFDVMPAWMGQSQSDDPTFS